MAATFAMKLASNCRAHKAVAEGYRALDKCSFLKSCCTEACWGTTASPMPNATSRQATLRLVVDVFCLLQTSDTRTASFTSGWQVRSCLQALLPCQANLMLIRHWGCNMLPVHCFMYTVFTEHFCLDLALSLPSSEGTHLAACLVPV